MRKCDDTSLLLVSNTSCLSAPLTRKQLSLSSHEKLCLTQMDEFLLKMKVVIVTDKISYLCYFEVFCASGVSGLSQY